MLPRPLQTGGLAQRCLCLRCVVDKAFAFVDNFLHAGGQRVKVSVLSRATDDLTFIHARYFVNASKVLRFPLADTARLCKIRPLARCLNNLPGSVRPV